MLAPLLLCLIQPAHAFPTVYSFLVQGVPESDGPGEQPGSPEFWYKLIVSIGLVLAGGVFAGCAISLPSLCTRCSTCVLSRLTLGLMGLDELHLRVLSTSSDDPKERKNAQTGVHHSNES